MHQEIYSSCTENVCWIHNTKFSELMVLDYHLKEIL